MTPSLTDQVYEARQRLGYDGLDMWALTAAVANFRAAERSEQVKRLAVRPRPKAKRSRNPVIEVLELGGLS